MFGRYFHSISTHAALLFRIVSLRSLNAEQHERMFQKAKGITKTTSNNHAQHVTTNIIQRLQFEEGSEGVIATQESHIKSLSLVVGSMKNTFFPNSLLNLLPEHYQSHLERISDYLLRGPGVWWEKTHQGLIFFDGTEEENYKEVGPEMKNFKSTTLSDISLYLHEQWEACISSKIQLPALHLRCYKEDGNFDKLITYTDKNNSCNISPSPLPSHSTPMSQSTHPVTSLTPIRCSTPAHSSTSAHPVRFMTPTVQHITPFLPQATPSATSESTTPIQASQYPQLQLLPLCFPVS